MYHGVQELVIAFYQALAEGRPAPVPASAAVGPVRWTEHVARAADRDFEERAGRFSLSLRVPFLVTGGTFGFTVAAMLVPLLSEFDVALGRTTGGGE